jgi:dipeptidyl aminopeptidase/acylaminoacyl peptidase
MFNPVAYDGLRVSAWLACVIGATVSAAAPCEALRHFTVADEIGLAHFGDPYTGKAQAIQISPDGRYVAVDVERGRIDIDRPEDVLRIYDAAVLRRSAAQPDKPQTLAPIWEIARSTCKDGPIITRWRWLADSSGIAYLERGENGMARLVLADLASRTVEPLTPLGAMVNAFDIRDRMHFVYTVATPQLFAKSKEEGEADAIVGTGRSLNALLFPLDKNPKMASHSDRSELWAVSGNQRFQVHDSRTGQPIILFSDGQDALSISPTGDMLATILAIPDIPQAWETQYPPPYAADAYRLRAGQQDLGTFRGRQLVSQYTLIQLQTGDVRYLTSGPTGNGAGWWTSGSPQWSQDGKRILLPGTFSNFDNHTQHRPCVAVITFPSNHASCVEELIGETPSGEYGKDYRYVEEVHFTDKDTAVQVTYSGIGTSEATTEYRKKDNTWKIVRQIPGVANSVAPGLQVVVQQGLNQPPRLVAMDERTRISRTIWDPNPQLKEVELGDAKIFNWKDKTGRDWRGGMYLPPDYTAGRRYPLVIQTHGFVDSAFIPSGRFPTAFAARALAGAGIIVLQVSDCPIRVTEAEGPCQISGYQAAVEELDRQGLIDPDRVGMVGFSRTCFYVMSALSSSPLKIRAASITDGMMVDYPQYLDSVDFNSDNGLANEYDAMIGAKPFGEGLHRWLDKSPLFNIEKVAAPLMVVAEGRSSLLFMWAPYAALRLLHKPVDLIVLNDDEHVLTNPGARLASQGGTVDWMRFWLQDYEDPDEAKSAQYARWRELRKLQATQQAARGQLSN